MNSKDKYKEIYKNEYGELLIKMATATYVDSLGEAIEKKKQALLSEENTFISEKSFDNFKKKLHKIENKNTINILFKNLIALSKRIAIFIGLITIIFIGGFSTVEAFKLNILNFFIEKTEKYTNINLTNDITSSHTKLPAEWQGYYYPSYIPPEFEILKSTINNGFGEIIYYNKNNEKIMFSFNANKQNLFLDTENVITKEIMLDDYPAQLIKKQNYFTIVFQNYDYLFAISGDVSEKELVRISNSLKKME